MSSPSPADILAKCAEAYASCRTYQDTGEVRSVIIRGPRPWERHTQRKPFRTAFERPDRFFFEYHEMTLGPEEEWHRGFVCSNEASFVFWSSVWPRALPAPPDLQHALAAFGGTSGGMSVFAAWLLMPTPEHNSLPTPATAELIGTELIDGHVCYRIRGARTRGPASDLWVGCEDHLVRREAHRTEFSANSRQNMQASMASHLATMSKDDPGRTTFEESIRSLDSLPAIGFVSESVAEFRPFLDVLVEASVFDAKAPT